MKYKILVFMQIMKIKERKKSVIMNHVVRLMDVLLLLFAESHSPSLELQMQCLLCLKKIYICD